MHAEDWSVAAAFSLSYRDLTAVQQQLFRRLGLHPGAEIDARVAAARLERALELYQALGIRRGEVAVLSELGAMRWASDDRAGQGIARSELGTELALTGDYQGAERELRQALDIVRETWVADSEADVLNNMGELARLAGDRGEALARHQRALGLVRGNAGPLQEAGCPFLVVACLALACPQR